METGVNKGVRKINYERGMKFGEKVYCGQDLRDLVGLTITDIDSDDNDSNVIMWLEKEDRLVAVYFDNLCFDGKHMSTVEHGNVECNILLRAVTADDLQKFLTMTRYYENDIVDDKDEKIGLKHVYCNDLGLEGTEKFAIKSLYVFYDGQILTEK